MKNRRTKNSAVFIVTITMIVVLPVIAYLQYTWLGELSERELEQMQENVRTSAFHCSMEFSQEISELMKSLGGMLSGTDADTQKELHKRITQWKNSTLHPGLIYDSSFIAPLPHPDLIFHIIVDEKTSLMLFKDLSAMTFPITGKPHHVIEVPINRYYIKSTLIPEIIIAHFLPKVISDYNISITDSHGKFYYGSVDSTSHDLKRRVDVRVPFLLIPREPPARLPPERRMQGERIPDDSRSEIPFYSPLRMPEFSFPPGEMPHQERGHGAGESGLLELQLTHRDGSLEAAVNNNRIRNLCISFGVLLLLGVSMIFVLISANRAQQLAQQQLEFVAGVSHELRTPLSVLKSVGENLADGIIQGETRVQQYGGLIKNEVVRLSEMVEKALAYAGIQSGNRKYEQLSFDIHPVISEAIKNAKQHISGKNVTIELAIDESNSRVRGDASAIQSAIENLIINGIKYSAEEKWIHIETHLSKNSNTSYLEITVKDHGIGIAPDDLPHIFDPFYRGSNAKEKQIQGNGLGLSIAKHIVESHGGTIFIESSSHDGSVFTIRLPLAEQKKTS